MKTSKGYIGNEWVKQNIFGDKDKTCARPAVIFDDITLIMKYFKYWSLFLYTYLNWDNLDKDFSCSQNFCKIP